MFVHVCVSIHAFFLVHVNFGGPNTSTIEEIKLQLINKKNQTLGMQVCWVSTNAFFLVHVEVHGKDKTNYGLVYSRIHSSWCISILVHQILAQQKKKLQMNNKKNQTSAYLRINKYIFVGAYGSTWKL